MEILYVRACEHNHWLSARYCFAILGKVHRALTDSVLLLSSRNLAVVIGNDKSISLSTENVLSDADVALKIASVSHDPLEHALVQETLKIISWV